MLLGKPAGAGQRLPPGHIDPTTPRARGVHGTPLSVKRHTVTLSPSGRRPGLGVAVGGARPARHARHGRPPGASVHRERRAPRVTGRCLVRHGGPADVARRGPRCLAPPAFPLLTSSGGLGPRLRTR